MGHLPGLISDLALILITGAITTLLFRKIRQPLVLGYIIAGFLVGPHISIFPTVSDTENIKIWADIGVIFLLFSLGLEFSFRKLKRIGGSASITAVVEIAFILLTGYLLGLAMGWSLIDSVFLGGMLASSSTTIISKAFDELGIKTQKYAGIVIGVLIVEDLIVVMLMVILSTVAATQQFHGSEMLMTVLKLLAFLVLWFITGIFIIPTFLKKARALLNEETLLILSIGLCLVMVVLAVNIGFSAELGAFIMGSILAETTSAEKIDHLVKPVKNLFGAVFFISVGMLIDPMLIIEYRWPILWVTLLVLGGKLLSTTSGALISGQPLKQSVQVGMSMAQVGEFAFIVASLGLSLKVTSDFLFPVAVGVSAITTFTTPYMIKFSPHFYEFLNRKLPRQWLIKIQNYSSGTQEILAESTWKQVRKAYINIVVTNSIIVIALFLLSIEFLIPFLSQHIENPFIASLAALLISLVVSLPFLWAVMAKRPEDLREKLSRLDIKYQRGPILLLRISRILIGFLLTGFLLDRLFSASIALLFGLPVSILTVLIFSRGTKFFYRKLEVRFLGNLNARDSEPPSQQSQTHIRKQIEQLNATEPWDVHLVDLEVAQGAAFIGISLKDLAWREKYGINIIYIKRGERLIFAPDRHSCLHAMDHAGIMGTDSQMQSFRPVFESQEVTQGEQYSIEDIVIQPVAINQTSSLVGLELGKSGIREATNGLIMGLERDGKRMINPATSTVILAGDLLWIAGERTKIDQLLAGGNHK